MRHLLLALPFTLLPLAVAHAGEHESEHGSLGAHEHGTAQLNVALDGQALELELESPAMNLVGFEHAASTAEDQARVAAVRDQLQDPRPLFGLGAGSCTVSTVELQSTLFGDEDHEHEEQHADEAGGEHSEIHAHYQLACETPAALTRLNLAELFKRFPATAKIKVQMIGPNGQQGAELSPAAAVIDF